MYYFIVVNYATTLRKSGLPHCVKAASASHPLKRPRVALLWCEPRFPDACAAGAEAIGAAREPGARALGRAGAVRPLSMRRCNGAPAMRGVTGTIILYYYPPPGAREKAGSRQSTGSMQSVCNAPLKELPRKGYS